MGGLQNQGRVDARPERLNVSRCTDTPLIPWLESGKSELGRRGAEIVSDLLLKLEELRSHPYAGRVLARVFGIGLATAIPEKPGQRIAGAGSKRGTEDVFLERHGRHSIEEKGFDNLDSSREAQSMVTATKTQDDLDLCYMKQLSLKGYAYANLIGRCA